MEKSNNELGGKPDSIWNLLITFREISWGSTLRNSRTFFCQLGIRKLSQECPCKQAATDLVIIGDELSIDSTSLVFNINPD
ncbi:hypothetical protein ACFLXB_05285 [Chloroflexota bacterium]